MKHLASNRLRGSLLRCLLLTSQPPEKTAGALADVAQLQAVGVSSRDYWMPQGFMNAEETALVDDRCFISGDRRRAMREWWLAKPRGAKLPNWDIASTCAVDGRQGLLLVEAKAHDNELSATGKATPTTSNGKLNHTRIGEAIAEANTGLSTVMKGWALSRDSHYQLSNRFAWAWKLAALGVPFVLVYLGFLHAAEMLDRGQPFSSSRAWQTCVHDHARGIIPEAAWQTRLEIQGTPLWFLIRSMHIRLEVSG